MAQHRSIRGTFTSKVKEAMNYAFGIKLPLINAQTTPSQVQDWKKKLEVRECHSKLFKKISDDQPTTFMTKIIERLWRERRNAPKIQIAFAISICQTYLDPTNQIIQMNEYVMKPKILKNMVSLQFKTLHKYKCLN